MRVIAILSLIVAGISLVLGLISRIILTPIKVLPGGVQAATFLSVAEIFLLAAIVFILLELVKVCKK
jgi:hypothetical protein